MPKYSVLCEDGHKGLVSATFAEFDAAGGVFICQMITKAPQHCEKPARVIFNGDPAVTIFTGAGFTRRRTDSRANRNIDHHDWRTGENWPGPPEKQRKLKPGQVTNWTADDFRKGAV